MTRDVVLAGSLFAGSEGGCKWGAYSAATACLGGANESSGESLSAHALGRTRARRAVGWAYRALIGFVGGSESVILTWDAEGTVGCTQSL